MGELQPLRDDLPQPVIAFAAALRELFKPMGISLTRYSARVNVDKSNVSRYLSGRTVPPWAFVRQLMVESTQAREGLQAPTQEVICHVQDLHAKAQAADNSPAGQLARLKDQLAKADVEVARARRSEERIASELEATWHQVAELRVTQQELEIRSDAERHAHRAEVALYQTDMDDLAQERERLFAKIAELASELEYSQARRVQAEQDCERLERELDSAERRASQAIEDLRVYAMAQRRHAEDLEKELADIELRLRERSGSERLAGGAEADRSGRVVLTWAQLLAQTEGVEASRILSALGTEEAARVIYELSPYDAAEKLKFVAPDMREQVLQMIPGAYQRMIRNRLL